MAHGITASDAFGYVGARAWHGLGNAIPAGLSAVEGFRRIGLGWETELWPLLATKLDENGQPTGQRIGVPERAHVRLDTGESLGVVGADYDQVSNQQLAEFADALAGADHAVTLETGGSLFGGRRVFALVKLPADIRIGATDDLVRPYVAITNGHGGTAAFATYPTTVRIVCANTLRLSERDVGKGVRFRHMGNMADKLRVAQDVLGLNAKAIERFGQQVNALAGLRMTPAAFGEYVTRCYRDTFGDPETILDEEARAKAIEKKGTTIAAWVRNYREGEHQRMAGIEGTAWAALNAVTEWHDHERGRGGQHTDQRIHSNLFGASHEGKRIALNAALTLI